MMYKFLKRTLDIIFSSLLILITLPIMIIIVIITLIDIGYPIMDVKFPREGKNKKPFYMFKIRTRIYDNEGKSSFSKLSLCLDKTGLNELPQLFNIIGGSMSFIGPRAFIVNEQLPKDKISFKRYLVKPGIIGLAQSLGGRKISHFKKLECDIIYYDNFGFKQDFKIFVKSIKQVFIRLTDK